MLYFFEDMWDEKFKFPEYLKATVGGLMVGGIALLYPQINGRRVRFDNYGSEFECNLVISPGTIFVKIWQPLLPSDPADPAVSLLHRYSWVPCSELFRIFCTPGIPEYNC